MSTEAPAIPWREAYANLQATLSDEQQAVVDDVEAGLRWGENRPLRVLATAGSGKSHTMVAAVSKALVEDLVRPEDVIVTTFTRKAAGELKARFRRVLPDGIIYTEEEHAEARARGRRLQDTLRVATYHSLAAKAIWPWAKRAGKDHFWSSALNIDLPTKERASIPQGLPDTAKWVTVDGLWDAIVNDKIPGLPAWPNVRTKFVGEAENVDPKAIAQAVEIRRARMLTNPDEAAAAGYGVEPMTAYAWRAFNEAKRAMMAWDFADSLHKWWQLSEQGDTKGARLFVVDECQDNSPIQMAIARNVAKIVRGRDVYVGDIRQSIYGFRGADPSIMAEADRTEGASTLELTTNFRSLRHIVESGNAICYHEVVREEGTTQLKPETWSVGSEAQGARPGNGEVAYLVTGTKMQRAQEIALEIREALDAGVSPADFAILSRMRATGAFYEVALLQKQIPAKIQGGSPFFRYRPINLLMAHVRLALGIGSEATLLDDFVLAARAGGKRLKMVKTRMRGQAEGGRKQYGLEEVYKEFIGIVPPPRRLDQIEQFFEDETSRRHRLILWNRDRAAQNQLDVDFENFVRTLQEVHREADTPAERLKNVGLLLHDEGLVVWPISLKGPDEESTAPVESGGGEGDGDAEMLSALLDISTGFATLEEMAWFSLKARGIKAETEASPEARGTEVEKAEKEEQDRVTVGTIHSAKGLEWKTVFLNADVGEIPSPRGDPAEEKRLLYVGVTRARDRLVLAGVSGLTPWVNLIRNRLNPPKVVETIVAEPEAAIEESVDITDEFVTDAAESLGWDLLWGDGNTTALVTRGFDGGELRITFSQNGPVLNVWKDGLILASGLVDTTVDARQVLTMALAADTTKSKSEAEYELPVPITESVSAAETLTEVPSVLPAVSPPVTLEPSQDFAEFQQFVSGLPGEAQPGLSWGRFAELVQQYEPLVRRLIEAQGITETLGWGTLEDLWAIASRRSDLETLKCRPDHGADGYAVFRGEDDFLGVLWRGPAGLAFRGFPDLELPQGVDRYGHSRLEFTRGCVDDASKPSRVDVSWPGARSAVFTLHPNVPTYIEGSPELAEARRAKARGILAPEGPLCVGECVVPKRSEAEAVSVSEEVEEAPAGTQMATLPTPTLPEEAVRAFTALEFPQTEGWVLHDQRPARVVYAAADGSDTPQVAVYPGLTGGGDTIYFLDPKPGTRSFFYDWQGLEILLQNLNKTLRDLAPKLKPARESAPIERPGVWVQVPKVLGEKERTYGARVVVGPRRFFSVGRGADQDDKRQSYLRVGTVLITEEPDHHMTAYKAYKAIPGAKAGEGQLVQIGEMDPTRTLKSKRPSLKDFEEARAAAEKWHQMIIAEATSDRVGDGLYRLIRSRGIAQDSAVAAVARLLWEAAVDQPFTFDPRTGRASVKDVDTWKDGKTIARTIQVGEGIDALVQAGLILPIQGGYTFASLLAATEEVAAV